MTTATPTRTAEATEAGAETSMYDVVVLGGGPGGYVAAIRAAQLGLRAAVVERESLGGICLNWGCIPSKALLRSAEVLTLINHAKDFGISVGGVEPDYAAALTRCQGIVDRQVKGVGFLMRKNKIDVHMGTGRLDGTGRVVVQDADGVQKTLQTRNVIVATGSRVRTIRGAEIDGHVVVSSREVWGIDDLPKHVVVLGAGAIGVEFATVFNAYGCDVTVVEMLPRILPLEDKDSSETLRRAFTKRGIKLLTETRVDRVEVADGKAKIYVVPAGEGAKGEPQTLEAERVLYGMGFLPNSENLGLEELGVKVERGFIQVNDRMETGVPGIYAIGDVTGKLMLAHVASAMGGVAAEVIAGHPTIRLDMNSMPRCTYSAPQVASMGLTEEQARAQGEVRVGTFPFRPNGKAMALGETDGQIKIIEDPQSGEILGAHLVGPDVTELIGEFSLARFLEATPEELARAVHPHPTLSEVIAEAALGVEGQPIHM
ncbi:MAG TPA: dihydrolipoyl dehydrogenase [Chloroflexota bacterium]|nr:dihydrolipoyl dehydrogenase [Chloroflexota bacterium]